MNSIETSNPFCMFILLLIIMSIIHLMVWCTMVTEYLGELNKFLVVVGAG
jgi:hypothetical protein